MNYQQKDGISFRPGQRVRYKQEYRKGMNANTVFTVSVHTPEGLYFKERKGKRFSSDYFESVQ